MSTWEKTSLLIEQQFPDFVRDEGPKLVAFLKAYYEWMERDGEVVERSQNLLNYRDVDNTLNQFIQYFQSEVADQIPRKIAADKRQLLKHVRDLYRAKGTERAWELLFRLLYDEEISFYYPGIDMLRVSDGRWIEETSVRVASPSTGDLSELGGETITGLTSTATARVDRVESVTEQGVLISELYISNLRGTFNDGEVVRNVGNTVNGTIFGATGPATGIERITVGGAGHAVGDIVTITGLVSGTGANGTITQTNDKSAITFSLRGVGAGYRLDKTAIAISGGTGVGGGFTIDGISNTESITFATTKVQQVKDSRIDGRDASSGISPTSGLAFGAKQANANPGVFIEANLAISNCFSTLGSSLQFSTQTVGSISAITVTDVGADYDAMPSITLRDDEIAELDLVDPNGGTKGQNALVTATNLAGAIATVSVNTQGTGYDKFTGANLTNIKPGFGGTNAQGFPKVTGVVTHPGFYDGTRGFLSWNNKLQDNHFYQEYSYVVRSSQFVNAYKEVAKAITHPAGTKMFGYYEIKPEIQTTSPTSWANGDVSVITNLKIMSSDAIISVPEVVSVSEQQYVNQAIVFATEINVEPYIIEPPVVTVPFSRVPKLIQNIVVTVQPTVQAWIPEMIEVDRGGAISFAESSAATIIPTAVVAGLTFSYQTTVVPEAASITVARFDYRVESSNVMARFYPEYITNVVEAYNQGLPGPGGIYDHANTPSGQPIIEYLLSANTMHSADYSTPRVRFITTPATVGRGLGEYEVRYIDYNVRGPGPRGVSVDIQPVDYLGATIVPTAQSELRLKYQPTAANTIPLSITTGGHIWHRLSGNVDIVTTTTIDDFDHLNISVYELTAINALGTNQALTGEATTWTWTGNQPRLVANGDVIRIADPFKYHANSFIANSQHTIERVWSNTLITISTGYTGTPLTNGAIYLANNITFVNTP